MHRNIDYFEKFKTLEVRISGLRFNCTITDRTILGFTIVSINNLLVNSPFVLKPYAENSN